MRRLRPAERRYFRRFWVAMTSYVFLVLAVALIVRHAPPPPGILRYAVAILPAFPVAGLIWAMGRYLIEETDEYQRMRHARAALTATGITMALCTGWGFLEIYAQAPHISLFNVFILFCFMLGLAKCGDRLFDRGDPS